MPIRLEPRNGSVTPFAGLEVMQACESTRLTSLDAFRGLTVAAMILVNNPGSWAQVYAPLRHAEWHGLTPTDLVFPFFLLIVGVAIPFSLGQRLESGTVPTALIGRVLRRSLILVGLGLAMRAIPDFDLATMRYYGVLQRIGLVYLGAGLVFLFMGSGSRVVLTVFLLLGYWLLMTQVPVPGHAAGDLSPAGNWAAWVDRLVLDGHLWGSTWDPEGLLSTLPALATALIGISAGEWLRSGRTSGSLLEGLLLSALLLLGAGYLWALAFPVNKSLWTSTYVLVTAGWGLGLLGFLYWAIDVRGWRSRWQAWMVVFGVNAITAFVASGMLTKALLRIRVGEGEGVSLYQAIYESGFRSWAGELNGSLAFALAYVLLWWLLMSILQRRGVTLKV